MKKFIPTLVLAGAIIALPLAAAYSKSPERMETEKAFHQADVIADGHIDAGEFDMYHQKIFRALDTNKDGILRLDECAGSCFSSRPGEDNAAASGTLYYKFEEIDADGSGDLEEYEYILYGRERFASYDTNDDFLIDVNEFCAFYRESMPCTFTAATELLEKKP